MVFKVYTILSTQALSPSVRGMSAKLTGGVPWVICTNTATLPQSKIKDFCQLPQRGSQTGVETTGRGDL